MLCDFIWFVFRSMDGRLGKIYQNYLVLCFAVGVIWFVFRSVHGMLDKIQGSHNSRVALHFVIPNPITNLERIQF